MSDLRCPLCGARKARRACPALGRSICAVCCGSKRLVEIACPSDCGWLRAAEQHPPAVVQKRQERDLGFIYRAIGMLSERQARVLLYLQALIQQRSLAALPPLLDQDVAEAARSLAATFETAAKGILYEHQASSLPAQRLMVDLRRGLQELAETERPVPDRDLAAALRMIEKLASDASGALGEGERSYLSVIDRVMKPAKERATAEAPAVEPRIIL
jgi:hypothetical protein